MPLQSVRLRQTKQAIDVIAQSPSLARLQGLDLQGEKIGNSRLPQLLESPYLSNLTRLGLGNNGLSDSAMIDLVRCESLKNVRAINLDQMAIRYTGLALLAMTPLGRNLEKLSIASSELSDADFQSLRHPDMLPQLQSLNLAYNNSFFSESVQAFFASPRFLKLRHLSMRECMLEASDTTYLGAINEPSELRSLNLDTANLREKPAASFAKSSCLHGLVELSLERCCINSMALESIIDGGNLKMLRYLNLSNNSLDSQAAVAIARWESARRLTRLCLGNNRIDSEGVAAIASSPHLGNLNELDLRSNDVDDDAVEALIESKTLNRITELRLTFRGPDRRPRFSAELKKKLVARFGRPACRIE